ncbi:hypothetical protein ABPG73_003531 [Tetrahymena malaccensis]
MEQIQMNEESDLLIQQNKQPGKEENFEQKQALCKIYQLCSQILNVIYSQKEFREEKLKKIQLQEKLEKFMSFGLIVEDSVSIEKIELLLKEIQINLDQILISKNKYIEDLQKSQALLRQQNQLSQSKIFMLIKNYDSEQNSNERQIILEALNQEIQQKSKIHQLSSLSCSNSSFSTLSSLGRLSLVQEESFDNLETQNVKKKQNSPQHQFIIQQLDTSLDLDFLKIKQQLQNGQQSTKSNETNMFFSDKIIKLSRTKKSEENFICLDSNYFYVFKELQQLQQNKRFQIKDITKITLTSHDQCELQIKKEYSLLMSISTRNLLINYIFSIFKDILKVKPPQISHYQITTQKNVQSINLSNQNLISNSQISLNELPANQTQND